MEKRDAYFDNAKLFLMILVVFGHFLQPFANDRPVYNDLYYFIFTFHMPAFILISGFFAKSGPKPITSLVKKLLLPYIFFQLLYSGYYTLIGVQDSCSRELGTPQWSLWFLLSLFFPDFMLGYVTPKKWIDKVKSYPKKWIALVLFGGLFLFIQANDFINKYWVFGSKPYEDYLNHPLLGGPQRFIFYLAGVIGITAFLLLVPKGRYFFSNWGRNTLTVYLLHGFLVKGLRALDLDFEISSLEVVLLFIGSMLLTALLSSKRVGIWIRKGKQVLQPSL